MTNQAFEYMCYEVTKRVQSNQEDEGHLNTSLINSLDKPDKDQKKISAKDFPRRAATFKEGASATIEEFESDQSKMAGFKSLFTHLRGSDDSFPRQSQQPSS